MPMTRTARDLLIVCAAGGLLLFAGLGRADLFNPDEPREAEMAREMLVSGDHVVPRLNGEPFLEKPPLFYWLVVTAYRAVGGPSEAAARAVPAIAGFLCLLITWNMARRLFGDETALLAALILLTGFESFWIARRVLIDMPLTLAILLAIDALHRVVTAERRAPWTTVAWSAVALAAALLFKGVVGAAIPGLALLGWLLWRLDLRPLWRRGILAAGLLAIVPVALWVRALHASLGPGAVREFVLVNNVQRFTGGAAKGHDNPFWYYLPAIVTDFFPWSLLLPFALAAAIRVASRIAPWATAANEAEERERAALRDLLVWFLLPVAVLSLASTKRGLYLLPIYPAAAILCGWWLARGGPGRIGRWMAVVAGAVVTGLVTWALYETGLDQGDVSLWANAFLLAVVGGAFLAWGVGCALRNEPRALGTSLAGAAGLALLVAATVVTPAIVNEGTSNRAAAADLLEHSRKGARIVLFDFREGNIGGFTFYAGRTWPNLRSIEALARHLDSDDRSQGMPLALVRDSDLERVRAGLLFPPAEVGRYRYRTRPWSDATNDYVLVSSGMGRE
jgi:4-amino-4-deoxy-L-arabinose transferase-like glycosyltransferase